ncbi:MAG: hypothetical protein AAGA15_00215 [Pseudomonadota bacterium]
MALFVLVAAPAQAYIGPGAGAGAIAVVLGVIGAIAMAFFAILWYPIKRMMKKRKAAKTTRTEAEGTDAS